MKFEPHRDGERMFAAMLPSHPGFRCYKAQAGNFNFVIAYDQLHGIWSATYSLRVGEPRSPQQCEPPPEGEKFKHYDSQHAAEAACRRKYKQLRGAAA